MGWARKVQIHAKSPVDLGRSLDGGPLFDRPGRIAAAGRQAASGDTGHGPRRALAPLDKAVAGIMLRHGIPGASLAITKDGRLVLAKGYGWANIEANEPANPLTVFPLASVSKVFTTLAIFKLIEAGKLTLDDKPFEMVRDLAPPPGETVNPQLLKITVRQLLNHSGGWNRNTSGDPINWSRQVAIRLQVPQPITDVQLIRYMLSQPLDFEPGTDNEYSNFGFILLGHLVSKLSGQPYEQYVRRTILEPLGMKATKLLDHGGQYFPGQARRYLSGTEQLLPPLNLPWADATAGWQSTVVDLARLMTALEGSRGKSVLTPASMAQMFALPMAPLKPRQDGSWWGLGWDMVQTFPKGTGFTKGGSWTGVRTNVKHTADNLCFIMLFNGSVEFDPVDKKIAKDMVQEVLDQVARLQEVPKSVDWFAEFP